MHRGRRQPFGNVAIEFGDRGIDAVAGVHEAGIGAEAAGEVVNRLVAPHGLRQKAAAVILCRPFGQLAFVVGLKRDAIGIHPFQVARHFGGIDTGIEIGQIPFR